MKLQKGFTLIELLVVMSIISMLSSVILASLNNAREKGRVAAALRFSKHTTSALSTGNTQYIFSFDNNGGAEDIIYNDLGTGHLILDPNANGTYCSSEASLSTETNTGNGYSLSIENDSCAKFSNPPPISSGTFASFAFSYWMKSSDASGCIFCNRTGGYISNGVSGGKPGTYINGIGQLNGNANVSDDKWHHIVWSFEMTSGTNVCNSQSTWTYQIYVDGRLDSMNSVSTAYCIPTGSGAYLGFDPGNTPLKYFGLIDDFNFFDRSLSHVEVDNLYANGIASHNLATEYVQQ